MYWSFIKCTDTSERAIYLFPNSFYRSLSLGRGSAGDSGLFIFFRQIAFSLNRRVGRV